MGRRKSKASLPHNREKHVNLCEFSDLLDLMVQVNDDDLTYENIENMILRRKYLLVKEVYLEWVQECRSNLGYGQTDDAPDKTKMEARERADPVYLVMLGMKDFDLERLIQNGIYHRYLVTPEVITKYVHPGYIRYLDSYNKIIVQKIDFSLRGIEKPAYVVREMTIIRPIQHLHYSCTPFTETENSRIL